MRQTLPLFPSQRILERVLKHRATVGSLSVLTGTRQSPDPRWPCDSDCKSRAEGAQPAGKAPAVGHAQRAPPPPPQAGLRAWACAEDTPPAGGAPGLSMRTASSSPRGRRGRRGPWSSTWESALEGQGLPAGGGRPRAPRTRSPGQPVRRPGGLPPACRAAATHLCPCPVRARGPHARFLGARLCF